MTVETTKNKSGPYVLDGVRLRFPRTFKMTDESHLRVIRVVDGVEAEITGGYTQTGIGANVGEVVFTAGAVPTSGDLLLLRSVPLTQETDYANQARVQPEQVERDFDKQEMQIQDMQEQLDRAVKVGPSVPNPDDVNGPLADALIRLNESADNIDTVAGSIGILDVVADRIDDVSTVADNISIISGASGSVVNNVDASYLGDGVAVTFPLPAYALADESVFLWVGGVRQTIDEYSVSGNEITLATAPGAGVAVDVRVSSTASMQDVRAEADRAKEEADRAEAAADAVTFIGDNIRKNNFTATRAPLPSDDASQGYAVGSRWLWQGQEWVAVSVAAGAARWAPVSRITPQLFGATGGGVINDSPAVQAWLTFIVINNIEGYVPAGDYLLNTAVSVTFSNKRFSIIGCGIGVSRFIVTSAGGGLLMDATDRVSQFTGKDFSVVARGVSRGTGLRFSLVPGGNQHQRSVILDNVETKGEGIAADCFNKFIDLTGNWRPLVSGCVVGGPFGPGASDNLTDASPMFVATAGLVIDHCYDPSVENCHVWSVRVGISARGTDQEALRLTNTIINGVRIGLDFYRTTREPIVWIDNCHVNFRDDGLRIDGARLVIIRGSHPYNEDGGRGYSGVPHDIWLKNTERVIIDSNIFHFDGHPNRINVFFDATTYASGLLMSGNIFGSRAAEAIRIGVGAANIHIADNQFPGTIGIRVNDLSSAAIISGQAGPGEYAIESQANSAASGPDLNLYRNSGSPAANDALAQIKMRGNNAAGTAFDFATVRGLLSNPSAGTEAGELQFFAAIAGALSRQLTVGSGVQVGFPTGGGRGSGSLNVAAGYHINGTVGAAGSFTTVDGKTVTVVGGIITGIA